MLTIINLSTWCWYSFNKMLQQMCFNKIIDAQLSSSMPQQSSLSALHTIPLNHSLCRWIYSFFVSHFIFNSLINSRFWPPKFHAKPDELWYCNSIYDNVLFPWCSPYLLHITAHCNADTCKSFFYALNQSVLLW